jgi:glycogen operon protein
MTEGDWNDGGASVLGMHLRVADDEVLIWFNRRAEAVNASLPGRDGFSGWDVGIVSDADAVVEVGDYRVMLPARSVLTLVPLEGDATPS